MFGKPKREHRFPTSSANETDEQIIANMERLKAMQEKGFRSSIASAIDAMASRLERRSRNRV